MSKSKKWLIKQMKLKKLEKTINGIMTIIFVSIFLILILVDVSGAVLNCLMCHKTVPGNAAIRAIDTIEISNRTCLKCHNPDYSPKSIGYDTHLAHVGKYSAKVDYLSRHPKTVESLSCDNCHMNIGENCQNCHIRNIPHIEPPLGYSCKGCHGQLDRLFQHPTIDLKIHNIFGVNGTRACAMCHNPNNMASLRLASGETMSMQDAYRLCFQCHSGYYNSWNSGQHYSNYTVPSDTELRISNNIGQGMGIDVQSIRSGLEDKWKKENTCQNCHNPHNPSELYQLTIASPEKTISTSLMDIILYILIVLVMIAVTATIFVIKKKKWTISDIKKLRLSDLKDIKLPKFTLSDIKNGAKGTKFPKLKLPKISIPISLSIEKLDKVGNGNEVEKKSYDDELNKLENIEKSNIDDNVVEKPQSETIPTVVPTVVSKPERNKFLHKYRYDIAFLLIICIILGSFYVIFGAFVPMEVVASESMTPHIAKGDVVFYTDISRIDEIRTYDKKNSINFEDYGDVIIYRPLGQEGVVPYIHRAMYHVDKDNEMWPGGVKAPYAGYITKGDNIGTNSQYDQQSSVSRGNPVKKEWIVGIARFRIPYIGYIRLMLP